MEPAYHSMGNHTMTSQVLKRGFTTGAAAAGAARAALLCLLESDGSPNSSPLSIPPLSIPPLSVPPLSIPPLSVPPLSGKVDIRCLNNEWITIKIHNLKKLTPAAAEAVVIKDAGDDPDVTHKAEIGARVLLLDVEFSENSEKLEQSKRFEHNNCRTFQYDSHISSVKNQIIIRGGKGVGMVTKPGLEVEPGNPAINSGPRKMILEAIDSVLKKYSLPAQKRIVVEIFVPEGEKLAEKTLNARLGIIGGISILGTTGIVKPMSHNAYIATIKSGISVARAMQIDTLVFTTGRRSERFAMSLFPDFTEEAFIQTGDFFKASLGAVIDPVPETVHSLECADIRKVIITVFFGKAVKMAMGFPHTHAAKSELTMKKLSQWAEEITGSQTLRDHISQANTARHAFTYIYPDFPELVSHVGDMIVKSAKEFSHNGLQIRSIIFDFEGNTIFDSGEFDSGKFDSSEKQI